MGRAQTEVFENKVLIIFGPKRKDVTEDTQTYTMKIFRNCT